LGKFSSVSVPPNRPAVRENRIDVARCLLEHDRTPMDSWVDDDPLEMVEFLLRSGAPKSLPDDPPWATPLAWATRRGHDKIATLLSQLTSRSLPPLL
jgi:ankyrin repeat protein